MILLLLLFFSSPLFAAEMSKSKIIGLIPMRNEEIMIEQCLRGLSRITDAIIILNDASTDNSVAIIEYLAKECNVIEIIHKKEWYRDEPGDRNALLKCRHSPWWYSFCSY